MKKLSIRAKAATGVAAGLLVLTGATGVAYATQEPANPTGTQATIQQVADTSALAQTSTLSSASAIEVAQAVQAAASEEGVAVTVAIVDRSGATRLIVRGDGAGPQTEESAKRKGFTAVSFGRPTADLAKDVKGDVNLEDIPGTLFLGGGVPVAANGSAIAGIGVAGAPSGDIDNKLAQAGLAVLEGKLG